MCPTLEAVDHVSQTRTTFGQVGGIDLRDVAQTDHLGTGAGAGDQGFHLLRRQILRFIDDQDAGAPEFTRLRAAGETHPIEKTGRELRKLMSWIKDADADYTEGTAAR